MMSTAKLLGSNIFVDFAFSSAIRDQAGIRKHALTRKLVTGVQIRIAKWGLTFLFRLS
jgi:hypothetical protein